MNKIKSNKMAKEFVLCFVMIFLYSMKIDSVVGTYKAGTVNFGNLDVNAEEIKAVIKDAAKLNVDILLVPSTEDSASRNYEETVKVISAAAKEAAIYVVTDVVEKQKCSGKNQLVRNNLVFDRKGEIVSIYKKPLNINANCNITFSEVTKFKTDFGVDFITLMEEDMVLRSTESFKEVYNFIVTGTTKSMIDFLNVNQFAPAWSFINNGNIVTKREIIGGQKTEEDGQRIIVADLNKYGASEYHTSPPMVKPSSFSAEDLSQFIIRPLDSEAMKQGVKETVCHGDFCCQFYVKASFVDSEANYGLAVYEGSRHYGNGYNIGTQQCAIVACATLYKRSCVIGQENNSTNVKFEEITVTGNFTKENAAQYPMFVSTNDLNRVYHQIEMHSKSTRNTQEITINLLNSDNVLSFGVFGRVYSKDSKVIDEFKSDNDLYDYIFTDDVVEFFDYMWIRIRILFVIVSIYVLEMM